MKITRKQLDKWLQDLRSGEYKQVTGLYYGEEDNEFCATGLLLHGLHREEDGGMFLDNQGVKRVHLRTHFGLDLGVVEDANDHGASFVEIADAVETLLETGEWTWSSGRGLRA